VGLPDEKYLLLTTFRRDGTPVATTVWVVPLEGDTFGFATSSKSGKAKRLAHTNRVTVQASDVRGRVKPGAPIHDATAQLTTGAQYPTIKAKLKAKYGFMVHVTKFLGTIGGIVKRKPMPYADVGVVITLIS
jgi:PPOX class probable F420-dependent enzyme